MLKLKHMSLERHHKGFITSFHPCYTVIRLEDIKQLGTICQTHNSKKLFFYLLYYSNEFVTEKMQS